MTRMLLWRAMCLLGKTGRQGGGVAFYVKGHLECIELHLGEGYIPVESSWLKIKGQATMGDIVVVVYYRTPDQEKEIDETFYKQLEVASQSQVLVLWRTYPDIWVCPSGKQIFRRKPR